MKSLKTITTMIMIPVIALRAVKMNLEEKEDIVQFIIYSFKRQGAIYPNTPCLIDGISCIVLVKNDMRVVMDLANRIIVLHFSRKIAEGTPAEIRTSPKVTSAYLGQEV